VSEIGEATENTAENAEQIESAEKSVDNADKKTETTHEADENGRISKSEGESKDNPYEINKYASDEYKAENVKSVEKGMAPEPNSEYYDNGIRYKTDDQGRTVLTEGYITNETAERNPKAQIEAGGDDRLDRDDGGHGVASSHGGSGEAVNLTPMDRYVNRGGEASFKDSPENLTDEQKKDMNENDSPDNPYYNINTYRDMERFLDSELKDGKTVYFQEDIKYEGDSKRPERYDVNIITEDQDGNTASHDFTFYNESKEAHNERIDEAAKANADDVKAEEAEREAKTQEARERASIFGEVED